MVYESMYWVTTIILKAGEGGGMMQRSIPNSQFVQLNHILKDTLQVLHITIYPLAELEEKQKVQWAPLQV